jgi:hypothetical protein
MLALSADEGGKGGKGGNGAGADEAWVHLQGTVEQFQKASVPVSRHPTMRFCAEEQIVYVQ